MTVIRSAKQMALVARRLRAQGKAIGVVPTMGALHEGHASLIRAAAVRNDVVIVTIFVNPLQFGPSEDFARYPRPFTRDLRVARAAGAAIIFSPDAHELYPEGFQTTIDVGALARRWEGQRRSGHFRGVATVVTLLFELTQPTHAYFGQKDYQQARVIQQLVRDLHLPLTVHVLPTVREPNGLAMSSRNAYLSAQERAQAAVLYQALTLARARIRAGERRAQPLLASMRRLIRRAPQTRIDYLAIVDAVTLEPVSRLRRRMAILLAVRVGPTRLIDNLLVDVS
ncbi:MAG: pantoate--beta-alanine ligase [Candidatus Omnitrophica bacterium]|nr:pantoate--beta-alanine ligase [Candidatus Omnitrophota bacterium]